MVVTKCDERVEESVTFSWEKRGWEWVQERRCKRNEMEGEVGGYDGVERRARRRVGS